MMRTKRRNKDETRAAVIEGAGRGFRKKGFGGSGVDGLAKEAGVTSGAFYGHFKSKEEAFRQVVEAGLEVLRNAIAEIQAREGDNWLPVFVEFYLNEKRTCDLGESCAMQNLTGEVVRADRATMDTYRTGMLGVVEQVAAGLRAVPADERQQRAWALLSMLAGAVSLMRALGDETMAAGIVERLHADLLATISAHSDRHD